MKNMLKTTKQPQTNITFFGYFSKKVEIFGKVRIGRKKASICKKSNFEALS